MNIDRVLKFELARLNVHLPERRISLRDALSSKRPGVKVRDGGIHAFKRGELDFLAKTIPEVDWGRLYLPILIALDPKLGRGAARITGEAEARAISQILGKKGKEELLIYRPEVAIIRRKLPTTTQYFFVPG